MAKELTHYIGGKNVKGTSSRFGDVYNPATGEVSGQVPLASDEEVNSCVANALAAFSEWAETPAPKRASVMFAMRQLMTDKREALAEAISLEHGKTLEDALGELQRGIDVVEFACGIPHLMKGELSPNVGGDIDTFSIREPLGVVGGITPFNFPIMVPCWMGVMAVACGNAFINKPSERDPSSAVMLGELWSEAGLPDGIWNVLNGDKVAVDGLLTHPDVPAISFVGSTGIGEYVYQTGTAHNKRVQAFCGAKNHMIVMPDANMDQAVDALMGAGYGSAGERCMAISVAVPVGEGTADALVDRLRPRVEALRIGAYDDREADMGPVITGEAKTRIEGFIAQGEKEGAELVVDGRGVSLQGYENGFFLGGSLFDRVTPDMEIYKQEIFGPVLSVARAGDFDQAVSMVNGHEYGNGVAIFTQDGDAARAFSKQVDVGMIGVNVPIPVPMAFHHFGGSKRSKFGDSQMHGPQSVQFFTKMKTVSARWPSGIKDGAQFTMPTNR
ncbi:MAG TPA: methylmalonate-semialdehyde dehydrogenase (CoA acylating) [Rhodospirillaceae bacterium]|nr:methylmalonate-semialdehyde dehydrogenase (CoA acylating) [Rhodospirillaceae bacterium]HAA92819.1 methylmalonate-semialdehyde dehydrogenase (CoA acylating) [Rhodospirillaceae bacterium]HAT34659.1 methylmalonate-semialdehyde dehydrogenase (CoA acylating) [Rhodospirillaceae bacterium]